MSGPHLHGSITALITPFKDGKVDEEALQAFVEWQIEEGTHALVSCGTTGESPTLSHDEDMRVTALCVEAAAGRVPVIAGTGSNSTDEAIALTRHAKAIGADAALLVAPYYNKPTQEGLYQHYKAIHDAVELKRPVATRLASGADFYQLSGEDATIVPFLAQGGHGCISVTANVAPRLCAELHNAWQARDFDTVSTINDRLFPLHEALFVESSPGPVKFAASLLGLCCNEVRLPLVTIGPETETVVRDAMTHAGLLN
jgi:4-hydroxy-tetrahydrodipicolinate synthase